MEQQGTRLAAKSVKPLELKKVTAIDPQPKAHDTDDLPPTVRIVYFPRNR